MTTALQDHQFELLANENDAAGIAFGIGLDVSVNSDGFDPGSRDWLIQDTVDPFSGGTRTGRDALQGNTWTWAMHGNRTDEGEVLASVEQLASAWWTLNDPGVVSVIRYALNGRVRRVYGRPRRWSAPPDNRILGGLIPITADFKCVDPLIYGDLPESLQMDLSFDSAGGFVFPVVFPVITLPGGFTPGATFVSGSRPTPAIIRFDGPLTDPSITTDDWTLQLKGTIPEFQWVTIDTRPWMRTVMLNDTYAVPGMLGPRTRLKDLTLKPGAQSFAFRGISGTGTGTATLKWYPAYPSL